MLANGLRVNQQVIKREFWTIGYKGDQIYLAAFVQVFDRRNGSLSQQGTAKTSVMGDVNGYPSHVKEGTATATGGIQTGDLLPRSQNPVAYTGAPSNVALPLVLYEGTLTDGVEAVVIHPTLWEWVGNATWYNRWQSDRTNASPASIWSYGPVQQVLSTKDLRVVVGAFTPSLSAQNTQGTDGQIGYYPSGTCYPYHVFCDRMIVISREVIEKAFAVTSIGGLPLGVL